MSARAFEMRLCMGSDVSLLIRTTRSGRTLAMISRRAPTPRANIETSTPTADMMPIRIVSANPGRCGILARFMRSNDHDCLMICTMS